MAMMKKKNITFSMILMCLIVVSPMAKAQIGGLLTNLQSVINISGLVRCSINATVSGNNVTSIPPFPNATVALVCAGQNIGTATTNANGIFSFSSTLLPISLSSILSNSCMAMVLTPLSTCNSSLPTTGRLTAPLTPVGNIISSPLSIFDFVAGVFNFA